MCQTERSGYTNVAFEPSKYDDYLVKTVGGTYEFAHFNQSGWTILGDNKSAVVAYWIPIPQHN